LDEYERISINCISWLGEEFQKFNGLVDPDEEGWLASYKPAMIRKKNCIYGKFVCSHYAFFTQREYLAKTNILSRYKNLIKYIKSENFVNSVKTHNSVSDN
jgi:hypothetical protein